MTTLHSNLYFVVLYYYKISKIILTSEYYIIFSLYCAYSVESLIQYWFCEKMNFILRTTNIVIVWVFLNFKSLLLKTENGY
jgi:hypothetical protein